MIETFSEFYCPEDCRFTDDVEDGGWSRSTTNFTSMKVRNSLRLKKSGVIVESDR